VVCRLIFSFVAEFIEGCCTLFSGVRRVTGSEDLSSTGTIESTGGFNSSIVFLCSFGIRLELACMEDFMGLELDGV
jgi:hypothetical protein